MPDFITDPRFVIPNVLAMLAIVITVLLYIRQQKRKELTFHTVGLPILSTIGGEFDDRIKVLFRDEEVQGLQHFLVTVRHSGNEPIKPEDYESQMSVDFGDDARVYECEISYKKPDELKVTSTAEDGKVRLGNPLLNPGDGFYLGALVTTPKKPVDLNARIAGLTRVRRGEVGEWPSRKPVVLYLMVLGTLYVGYVALALPDSSAVTSPVLTLATGLMTALSVATAYLVFTGRGRR